MSEVDSMSLRSETTTFDQLAELSELRAFQPIALDADPITELSQEEYVGTAILRALGVSE